MNRLLALALAISLAALSGCFGSSDKPAKDVQVLFVTTAGNFTVETDRDHAPRTVDNFLAYVGDGFYDGLTIHRVSPNVLVQGGGLLPDYGLKPTTRPPVPLEATPRAPNLEWTLAMARGEAADSATTQFFINLRDNPQLDAAGPGTGYAVFAHVVAGFDNITAMTQVEPGPAFDQASWYPQEPIIIFKARSL